MLPYDVVWSFDALAPLPPGRRGAPRASWSLWTKHAQRRARLATALRVLARRRDVLVATVPGPAHPTLPDPRFRDPELLAALESVRAASRVSELDPGWPSV